MRPCIAFVTLFVLAATLGAADSNGYLKARGRPTGAGLFVDGKYVGPAGRFTVPEKYAVNPGDHEVALRDPRFEDFTTKVTVRASKTTKIKYKLKRVEPAKPPFGRLRLGGGEPESFISVSTGDTGPVYINDRYWGFVDEFNNAGGGMLLPAGAYKLHVVSQVYGDITKDVTVVVNKVTMVDISKK